MFGKTKKHIYFNHENSHFSFKMIAVLPSKIIGIIFQCSLTREDLLWLLSFVLLLYISTVEKV